MYIYIYICVCVSAHMHTKWWLSCWLPLKTRKNQTAPSKKKCSLIPVELDMRKFTGYVARATVVGRETISSPLTPRSRCGFHRKLFSAMAHRAPKNRSLFFFFLVFLGFFFMARSKKGSRKRMVGSFPYQDLGSGTQWHTRAMAEITVLRGEQEKSTKRASKLLQPSHLKYWSTSRFGLASTFTENNASETFESGNANGYELCGDLWMAFLSRGLQQPLWQLLPNDMSTQHCQ